MHIIAKITGNKKIIHSNMPFLPEGAATLLFNSSSYNLLIFSVVIGLVIFVGDTITLDFVGEYTDYTGITGTWPGKDVNIFFLFFLFLFFFF